MALAQSRQRYLWFTLLGVGVLALVGYFSPPDQTLALEDRSLEAVKDKICRDAYQIYRYHQREIYEIAGARWDRDYKSCELAPDQFRGRGTKKISITYEYTRGNSDKYEREAPLLVTWDGERVEKVKW